MTGFAERATPGSGLAAATADDDARVRRVSAAAYAIPTELPEADGTLAWTSTTLVVATVAADGLTGTGYTYASAACAELIEGPLAGAITGASAFDTTAAWQAMVRTVRNMGRPGLASYAIAAVDAALWDLKGILLGQPAFRLLGGAHAEVPVYGSGGFTTYNEAAARAQLERWTAESGIPRVKIKIGESWGTEPDRDLARVAFAREVIGPDVALYVDANGGYNRKQAIRMARAMEEHDVTWFEEPVSSDDLDGLREVRDQVAPDVAAGEYGYDLAYFTRMVDAKAVDCLQVDATRCGGLTEWLRAAAVAAGKGLDVSAHCAPALHAHACAAIPNLRHLEYFHDHARIEAKLFDGSLAPGNGVLRLDPGRPGLGITLRQPDADHYRVG